MRRGPCSSSRSAARCCIASHLPPGRAQSDAGTAPGRSGAAGSTGLRADVRSRAQRVVWRRRDLGSVVAPAAATTGARTRSGPASSAEIQKLIAQAAQKLVGLPAANRGRQAWRGGTKARTVEAHARRIEQAPLTGLPWTCQGNPALIRLANGQSNVIPVRDRNRLPGTSIASDARGVSGWRNHWFPEQVSSRALCVVVFIVMLAALVYAAWIGVGNFSRIHV